MLAASADGRHDPESVSAASPAPAVTTRRSRRARRTSPPWSTARDLTMPIPTCPEWTLRELAIHVGRASGGPRRSSAPGRPSSSAFRSVPDGRLPDEPAAHAAWLAAGARAGRRGRARGRPGPGVGRSGRWPRRATGPGGCATRRWSTRPTRSWPPGGRSASTPDAGRRRDRRVADRAHRPGGRRPDPRAAALPAGAALHVHATDEGLAGRGRVAAAGTSRTGGG